MILQIGIYWCFSLFISVHARLLQKDFKPDVFILTDISNEPDDAESLVRFLLYTNEVSLKGLVATTSVWLNYTIHDEDILPIIDAYEKVHSNLLKHSLDYPTADYLRSILATGKNCYGTDSLLTDKISQGAKNLIKAVDEVDSQLYLLVWGGATVLAEALQNVRKTRQVEEINKFVEKITTYTISDQDNSGVWIRQEFPKLKFITSLHSFNDYDQSAWVGMSGEEHYMFDSGGPDSSLVSPDWLRENVQSVGPLGETYPDYAFIMEGDTPASLYIIPNGLSYPSEPNWGSWGGRYKRLDPYESNNVYTDTSDTVIGKNGKKFMSNKATIWRWRKAVQFDFAARMQWTVKEFNETQHQPIIVANGTISVKPTFIEGTLNDTIVLDLSKSYSLNGDDLIFTWFHYREPTATNWNVAEIPEIELIPINDNRSIVKLEIPLFPLRWFHLNQKQKIKLKSYHIIAEVTNSRDMGVSTYKRFVINCHFEPENVGQQLDPINYGRVLNDDEEYIQL